MCGKIRELFSYKIIIVAKKMFNLQHWKTTDKKNVKNVDLWKKLKDLVKSKQIEWCWVKSHSGDTMNDLADKLAKEATPI